MTTNIVNKWRLDITGSTSSRSVTSRQHSDTTSALLSPPGFKASSFSATASQQTNGSAKADHQQQQQLLSKRAWDIAFGPAKSLPMNMFMMYMAGNTISIFPIMMVAMMVWRPIKALMSVSGMFRPIESEISSSLILHKLVFILGNLGAVGLAVYKCHSMGLLPNHASDWLDFAVPPERVQHALVGEQFI